MGKIFLYAIALACLIVGDALAFDIISRGLTFTATGLVLAFVLATLATFVVAVRYKTLATALVLSAMMFLGMGIWIGHVEAELLPQLPEPSEGLVQSVFILAAMMSLAYIFAQITTIIRLFQLIGQACRRQTA